MTLECENTEIIRLLMTDTSSFSFHSMLQVGEWQGGKHQGSICREGRSIVVELQGTRFRLAIADFADENAATEAAANLRAEQSLSRNLTKNRYRYVTDPTSQDTWLEVQLSQGRNFICDPIALPLVEKHTWHAVYKGGLWYTKTHAGYFHKLLTGFRMTDHTDRNGLNNRASNLTTTTPLHNQHNRRISRRNVTGRAGVLYSKDAHAYKACLGSTATKTFSITKYGNGGAFAHACNARLAWERENDVKSEVGQMEAPPVPTKEMRTYKCPLCNLEYAQSYSLRRHIRIKH